MSDLQTFEVPQAVTGTPAQRELGRQMLAAWRRDGIFQIAATPVQQDKTTQAFAAGKRFFRLPPELKSRCIDDLTYAGYVASGEHLTDGEADHSEIFAVCRDVPLNDPRVRAAWPCHGPVPWPDEAYHLTMRAFMDELGQIGERLLRLTALALDLVDPEALIRLTRDGWHHMRVLRFPAASRASARGIGAHTDYGLLVIAAQDDVGGLFIRPPVEGERRMRNWLPFESSAGWYENDDPWTFVTPVPNVFTAFPGDILQFLTGGYLLATPHKVGLADRERFALAYFHEPGFDTQMRPLLEPGGDQLIHYGMHFTQMFMRGYPQRTTTRRILAEDRLATLQALPGTAPQALTRTVAA
jgi:2-oxoglutarate dioxygenase / 2-oxoglutarate/L-arginine monooxygenase/decarboxylase